MNQHEVEHAVRTGFTQVLQRGEGVFRAEKEHNETTYQVCYVDASQHIFAPDFDLDDYQRRLLMEDYYSLDGALQWNFYLYFLVDEERKNDQTFEELKHRVEEDKNLARKFLLTLSEFESLLSPSKVHGVLEAPLDIIDLWKKKLSSDLADVFDETINMKSVVATYLTKKKGSRAAPSIQHHSVKPFPLIKQLKLVKYREFPKRRSYEFGYVNLIHGPNAVGKTSLLEAVELAACGKTIRNSEKVEKFQFKLTPFDSDAEINMSLQSEVEYRSRDHFWYGRNYPRDNHLHESFARFNYFDADAAVRFSERIDKGGGVGKTLTQVVFGPDVDRIFQRIEKIRDLFETENRALKNVQQTDEITMKRRDLELQEKTRADAEVVSQDAVKHRLQTLNILLDNYQPEALEKLIRQLGESSVSIASWNTARDKFGIETYASFDKTITLLKKISGELEQYENLVKSHLEKENKANKLLHGIGSNLKLLERLREYESSGAINLPRLNEHNDTLTKRIQNLDEAIRLFSKVDNKVLQKYIGFELLKAKEQIRSELMTLRERESEHQSRLQQLKKHLDQASLMIKQIRSLGDSLVEQNPETDECPLCGTNLKPSTLAKRLEKPIKTIDSTRTEIDELLKSGTEIAHERTATESRSVALELIVQGLTAVKKDTNIQSTIAQLLKTFEQVRVEQLEDKGKLEVVKQKILLYSADGFTIEELNRLEQELKLNGTSNSLLQTIETRITDCKNELNRINSEIVREQHQRNAVLQNIQLVKSNNSALMKDLSAHSALETINDIRNLLTEVEQLKRILPLSNHDTPSSVSTRLSEAKQLVSTYLRSVAEQKSLVELQTIVARLDESIRARDITLKASVKAINILTKVILEEKPEKFLEVFLSKYQDLISIIFDQIHSPREFNGIVLQGNELYARRISDNTTVGLTELSTGQRTALVLSVFLAMNKAIKKGPRTLIFDDPVAYVDDMNVLSFLDYLQKLAIEGDRQIFFTTANQRIATLFAKKFDFLSMEPNGFKSIKLSRLEYDKNVPLLS